MEQYVTQMIKKSQTGTCNEASELLNCTLLRHMGMGGKENGQHFKFVLAIALKCSLRLFFTRYLFFSTTKWNVLLWCFAGYILKVAYGAHHSLAHEWNKVHVRPRLYIQYKQSNTSLIYTNHMWGAILRSIIVPLCKLQFKDIPLRFCWLSWLLTLIRRTQVMQCLPKIF